MSDNPYPWKSLTQVDPVRVAAVVDLTALQAVEGYVWCDKLGEVHNDTLNPYGYVKDGNQDYCTDDEHRALYMEADDVPSTRREVDTALREMQSSMDGGNVAAARASTAHDKGVLLQQNIRLMDDNATYRARIEELKAERDDAFRKLEASVPITNEPLLGLATTESLFRELITRFRHTGDVSMTLLNIDRCIALAEMLGGMSAPEREYRTVES